jgi:hypothetical protein
MSLAKQRPRVAMAQRAGDYGLQEFEWLLPLVYVTRSIARLNILIGAYLWH